MPTPGRPQSDGIGQGFPHITTDQRRHKPAHATHVSLIPATHPPTHRVRNDRRGFKTALAAPLAGCQRPRYGRCGRRQIGAGPSETASPNPPDSATANSAVGPTQPSRGLAQPTAKIRTIYGPETARSTSAVTFALVSAMQAVYHQQTKNLLGRTRTAPSAGPCPCPRRLSERAGLGLSVRSPPRNDSESINPRCPSSTERSQHQVSTGQVRTGDDVGF